MKKTLFCAISAALAATNAAAQETITLDTVNAESEKTGSLFRIAPAASAGVKLSAKETPQSVTAISQAQMQDQRLTSVDQVLKQTVGVDSQPYDRGRSYFNARGFDINKYRVDGMDVSYSAAYTANETLADATIYERVEVTRGAAGLTNGAGNPSAAVNFVRKHADSRDPKTVIEASAGSYDDYSVMIDHGQAFNQSGTVRGRVIGKYQKSGSFIEREKDQQGTLYGVIDADITPTTSLSTGISYNQRDRDGVMWGSLQAFFADGTETDWARSKNNSADWTYWNSRNTNYFAELKQKLGNDWELTAKANYAQNRGDTKLFYVSSTTIDANDPSKWNPWPYRSHLKRNQANFQVEASGKYNLFGRQHEAAAGVQYSRNHSESTNYNFTNLAPATNYFTWNGDYPEPTWTNQVQNYRQTDKETGLYASTRINATDKLHFIAGARLSYYKTTGISYGASLDKTSNNIFTPYAGIVYDINDQHSLYASYTDIFQPQAQRTKDNESIDPIRGANYEIGWKGSFMDNQLQTQASVFYIRQNNLAQEDGSNKVAGTTSQAYYAAKGAHSYGFELEASGQITPEWHITGGYSQWEGSQANGEKINTRLPRKQFKLFTAYQADRLANGLTLGGGVTWQSATSAQDTNSGTGQTQRYGQDSYALASLMARYQLNKNFSTQLNIDNLFNKKYRAAVSGGRYLYGAPRTVTATFRYEF